MRILPFLKLLINIIFQSAPNSMHLDPQYWYKVKKMQNRWKGLLLALGRRQKTQYRYGVNWDNWGPEWIDVHYIYTMYCTVHTIHIVQVLEQIFNNKYNKR